MDSKQNRTNSSDMKRTEMIYSSELLEPCSIKNRDGLIQVSVLLIREKDANGPHLEEFPRFVCPANVLVKDLLEGSQYCLEAMLSCGDERLTKTLCAHLTAELCLDFSHIISSESELRARSSSSKNSLWEESQPLQVLSRLRQFYTQLYPPLIPGGERVIYSHLDWLDEIAQAERAIRTVVDRSMTTTLSRPDYSPSDSKEVPPVSPVKGSVDSKIKRKNKKSKQKTQQRKKSSLIPSRHTLSSTETQDQLEFSDEARKVLNKAKAGIPKTKSEAEGLLNEWKLKKAEVLQCFICSIRTPELSEHLLNNFLGAFATTNVEEPRLSSKVQQGNVDVVSVNSVAEPSEQTHAGIPFPSIQPLKAAQCFNSDADNSDFGAWKILMCGRAIRDFRQLGRNFQKIIVAKLIDLSHGHFSDDNQKRLNNFNEHEVAIYEAKTTRDRRIVYEVALLKDSQNRDVQILKVWAVLTHAEMDGRLWASLGRESRCRTAEYIKRTKFRSEAPSRGKKTKDVFDPKTFPTHVPHDIGISAPERERFSEMSDKDMLELHDMIALQKFVVLSRSVLNSILSNDSQASHVFVVSDSEAEIINHPSSLFLLGRSGTGKTTSMLFRLLGLERASQEERQIKQSSHRQLRQLFVTQSPMLTQKVSQYFRKLQTTLRSGSIFPGCHQSTDQKEDSPSMELVGHEEDDSANLPKRFSELKDEHFPLFLSFDTLCRLLEADYGINSSRRPRGRYRALLDYSIDKVEESDWDSLMKRTDFQLSSEKPPVPGSSYGRGLITLDAFQGWWPHFDQRLTKGLDPTLVFSEILGVIEGGEFSFGLNKSALTREEYIKLSTRNHDTFAMKRDRVYELYEAYVKRKAESGRLDGADRTQCLLSALMKTPPKFKLDYIYMDESQDNLILDCQLIRMLSQNPAGFFFAGDTCQTISSSSFRFAELKASFFRAEKRELGVKTGLRPPIKPAFFSLAVNYRSHNGIVSCADSVVQLMLGLFPHSIDRLAPERGLVPGPKPVMFTGWENERGYQFQNFLFGDQTSSIEFGAEQCIIVRNDKARDQLRDQIGNVGLIFTLYESKGLEFSDILLYNLFADGPPTESEWRVVLSLCDNERKAPTFDAIRHASIKSELKHLYVALTRARRHIWLFDLGHKSRPMQEFWREKNLVRFCGPRDPSPILSISNTPEDWDKQGRVLFKESRLLHSAYCFEKANKPWEVSFVMAHHERQCAQKLGAAAFNTKVQDSFVCAAKGFTDCATGSPIALTQRCHFYAALCYLEGEKPLDAAKSFEDAGEWTKAVSTYHEQGSFEDIARILTSDANASLDDQVAVRAREACQIFFLNKNQVKKASLLFNSPEEQLGFMEDWDFASGSKEMLEELQEYEAAANLWLEESDSRQGFNLKKAANLYSRASNRQSKLSSAECYLKLCWLDVPLGSAETADPKAHVGLLDDAAEACSRVEDSQKRNDISNQVSLLRRAAARNRRHLLNIADVYKDGPFAFYAYDLALHGNSQPQLIGDTFEEQLRLQETYLKVAQNLHSTLNLSDQQTQQVFGFAPLDEKDGLANDPGRLFCVRSGCSRLGLPLTDEENKILRLALPPPEVEGGQVFRGGDLERLLKHFMASKIARHLIDHDALTVRSPELRPPCQAYIMNNPCENADCNRRHITKGEIRPADFDRGLRRFVLQLRIMLSLEWVLSTSANNKYYPKCKELPRKWIEILHSNLFPINPLAGSLTVWLHRGQHFDELTKLVPNLISWTEGSLFDLGRMVFSKVYFAQEVLYSTTLFATFNSQRLYKSYHNLPISTPSVDPMFRPESLDPYSPTYSLFQPFVHYLVHPRIRPGTLSQATLFLRRILENSFLFKIDLNILMYHLERLGVLILLGYYSQGIPGRGLDQFTLPGSLMPLLLENSKKSVEATLSNIRLLGYAILDLLYRVSRGKGESGEFGAEANRWARIMVITRIGRLFSLLSCNLDGSAFPETILRRFENMPKLQGSSTHPEMYRRYLEATTRQELELALIHPMNPLAEDTLFHIHITASTSDDGYRPPPGTTLLSGSTASQISESLFANQNPDISFLDCPPTVVPSATKNDEATTATRTFEDPQHERRRPHLTETDLKREEKEEEEELKEVIDTRETTFGEQQIKAAIIIQRRWKQLTRETPTILTEQEKDLRDSTKRYLKISTEISLHPSDDQTIPLNYHQIRSIYIKYLLVSFPPASLILIRLIRYHDRLRKKLQEKRTKEQSPRMMETIASALKDLRQVRKRLDNVKEFRLAPNSRLHKDCDPDFLRDSIRELVSINRDLTLISEQGQVTPGSQNPLDEDLEMILQVLQKPVKRWSTTSKEPLKPKLNTSDLDDF